MQIIKSVRNFDALLNMWGIDKDIRIFFERNKMNKLFLKHDPELNSPRFLKAKPQIKMTDSDKLEAMLMKGIGFDTKQNNANA